MDVLSVDGRGRGRWGWGGGLGQVVECCGVVGWVWWWGAGVFGLSGGVGQRLDVARMRSDL